MSYDNLNHYLGEEDYYAALGIDSGATAAEVKLAFQKLAVRCEVYSPNPQRRERAAHQLARITRAYELLSNPARRAKYDRFLYGNDPPESPRVARFYHEGYKAFRQGNLDLAVNRLLEAVRLHPHRNIYRVHLAMAYAEKGWKQYALEELRRAIAIHPDDFFAQEALARVETMDKVTSTTIEITPRFKKQVAGLAAACLLVGYFFMNGTPQRAATALTGARTRIQQTVYQAQQGVMERRGSRTIEGDGYAERPGYGGSPLGTASRPDTDPQHRTIGGVTPAGSPPSAAVQPASYQAPPATGTLPLLSAEQLPPGQDFARMHAVKKTYYPQDNVVVVIYEDGAVMTYKPDDLVGWYRDDQNGLAVMVTRDREAIPASLSLPLLLPDGSRADLNAPGFPTHLFPEYTAVSSSPYSGETRRGM